MAINLNDNLKIGVGNPIDSRYLSSGNTAYSGSTLIAAKNAVTTAISISQRYVGLTVLLSYTGETNIEYWFKAGVQDGDLEEKKFASEQLVGDFITGATNLGYFSGKTGIQSLDLSSFPADGYYFSELNWYYGDTNGIIQIGSPTHDGPLRRAYVNVARDWSWIYDAQTTQWVLSNQDVITQVGNPLNAVTYAGSGYTEAAWSTGFHTNGSTSITAAGSLTTGATVTVGAPVYSYKANQDLNLFTPISDTPNFLKITNDNYYIRFSGVTSAINATNVGTGSSVFKSKTGTTLQFRKLRSSGNTTVSQVGDEIRIYSAGGTGSISVNNVGGGTGDIYRDTTGTSINLRTLVGTGDVTIITSGDTVTIDSQGGGTYNLASPSAIPVGGICTGTVLTGKTSFELWEELLVPELCGSITAPSLGIGLTASGLYEIACNISQTVSGTFSSGSINPQYCSLSNCRSGLPNAYCYTGTGMPAGFQACTSCSPSCNNPSYDVVIGTQSWTILARYDCGLPALGSKGTQYCAALVSGCTSAASNSIVGVYPLWATTSTIAPPLTKQTLVNMSTGNNILVSLVAESGGNKQKFEVPCAWLGAPTSRPLVGVCQWNTVSSQWEYPGGSAGSSLTLWTPSSTSETVQTFPIGYCQYTYNGVDRSSVCIRLVF